MMFTLVEFLFTKFIWNYEGMNMNIYEMNWSVVLIHPIGHRNLQKKCQKGD